MSFEVNVSSTKPSIALQILKNTITVYFTDSSEGENSKASHLWSIFEKSTLELLPYNYNKNWFRGSDEYHIKFYHTNPDEIKLDHIHREFYEELTPEVLERYMTGIWEQQTQRKEPYYNTVQFFSEEKIKAIVEQFSEYYQNYKGSIEESLNNEEKKQIENESFERQDNFIVNQSDSEDDDIRENQYKFFVKRHNEIIKTLEIEEKLSPLKRK